MPWTPIELGEWEENSTVTFHWNSVDASGVSVTRSTDGALRIYKDSSGTQRSSASGITDTEDFDSVTGLNFCSIDLSDDTDLGFYEAGSKYYVVLIGADLGDGTLNVCIAEFTIASSPILRQSDVVSNEDFIELVRQGAGNALW
jgi:hypothetical protein